MNTQYISHTQRDTFDSFRLLHWPPSIAHSLDQLFRNDTASPPMCNSVLSHPIMSPVLRKKSLLSSTGMISGRFWGSTHGAFSIEWIHVNLILPYGGVPYDSEWFRRLDLDLRMTERLRALATKQLGVEDIDTFVWMTWWTNSQRTAQLRPLTIKNH